MKLQHIVALSLFIVACQPPAKDNSDLKVTSVEHTAVKQQSIGNCWLYAHATWLESKLKASTGQDYDVSETYWTYWDFYRKLVNQRGSVESLQTGGFWRVSKDIIKEYGWVEEKDFIADEQDKILSGAQACAESFVNKALEPGGLLHDEEQRTPETVRAILDEGFSCEGRLQFNMDEAYAGRRLASETMLFDSKQQEEKSLSEWLDLWSDVSNRAFSRDIGYYEGKKLPDAFAINTYRELEQRIKRALNDRQPVVIAFHVTFNAPDDQGLFNLTSLADRGEMGSSGGHMVVLHDYTAHLDLPEIKYLVEGDMSDEFKALALEGNLDYLVTKNSWGANRGDRFWLKNGYTRLTWDYLTSRYFDEENEIFRPFLQSIVFPPGY